MLIKSNDRGFEPPYFLSYLLEMVLEHYISELLYRYNCVMVPGFGAFLTQMKSAVIQNGSNVIYPPSKTLAFNEQLATNDGLLVSYMAEAEQTTYDEMLKRVSEKASEWKKRLINGERLELTPIGELWSNSEHRIQFEPYEKVNYLTSSFGLSSFVSMPVTREVLKKEVAEIEERVPFIFTPEKREEGLSMRPYLKYAAIVLLTVSLGLTAYRSYNESLNQKQLVREEAQEQVSKHIQEATFFDTTPMELPTLSLDVILKEETVKVRMHHIVAGAFRFQKNADKKLRQLKRRGYNPSYIGTNAFGLHMVTFDSYTDTDEALNALRLIKSTQSPDAWLLSTK